MPPKDRERAIKGLADGSVQVVTSCDVISEGVDVPVMAGAILLRRTMSLALYLQQVGRALRKYPGKENAKVSAQQRKTPEQIAGELVAALPVGVDQMKIKNLTGFINKLQTFDAKTRQRAMIAKAAELQNRGEIDALAKAIGYK